MIEIKRKTDIFRLSIDPADAYGLSRDRVGLMANDKCVAKYLEHGDFEVGALVDATEPPGLQDLIAGQYELTDGSYLVILDKSRDNFRERTPLGRIVFNTTHLVFYAFTADLRIRRRLWMVLMPARWAKPDGPPHIHTRQRLAIDRLEEVSPTLLKLHLFDGKEIRLRFFKKGPRRAPLDWGGLYIEEREFGGWYEVPYRVHHHRRVGWRSFGDFFADVFDLLVGGPVRSIRIVPF